MKLNILGCNSAVPTLKRRPTAQILNIDEQYSLIDCGEGTQIQLLKFGLSHFKIRNIFISHLHGDHYFGLIGLLNTMGLAGREKPLYLYGPPALIDILEMCNTSIDRSFGYDLIFHPLEDGAEQLIDHKNYAVRSFPTEHGITCHGFRFDVHKPKLRLLPEKCASYNIPIAYYRSIKNGADYENEDGQRIPNTELTTPLEFTNYSYAFAADTCYTESIIDHVRGVHTLYHESTYLEGKLDKAMERKHSTAAQAAKIAATAEVERLILGHFSSAYPQTQPFLDEAKPIFSETILAFDGLEVEWPKNPKP